jgi:hypothetical protein
MDVIGIVLTISTELSDLVNQRCSGLRTVSCTQPARAT